MHRAALAGTKRQARSPSSLRSLRTRALENWLARHGTSGCGAHGSGGRGGLRSWRRRTRRRSFVYRPGTGLRNDHARRGRLRRRSNNWRRGSNRTRHSRSRRRRSGSRYCRRRGRGRRNHGRRRRRGTWRCSNRSGRRSHCRLLNSGRSNNRTRRRNHGRYSCRRRCRWNSRSRNGRRSHYRLGHDGRRNGRSRSRFFLLGNCFQYISGAGDVRQIDLGLDFIFTAQGTRGARRGRLRFGRAADVGSDFFRFMLLQRTGMRLLLRHSDER